MPIFSGAGRCRRITSTLVDWPGPRQQRVPHQLPNKKRLAAWWTRTHAHRTPRKAGYPYGRRSVVAVAHASRLAYGDTLRGSITSPFGPFGLAFHVFYFYFLSFFFEVEGGGGTLIVPSGKGSIVRAHPDMTVARCFLFSKIIDHHTRRHVLPLCKVAL